MLTFSSVIFVFWSAVSFSPLICAKSDDFWNKRTGGFIVCITVLAYVYGRPQYASGAVWEQSRERSVNPPLARSEFLKVRAVFCLAPVPLWAAFCSPVSAKWCWSSHFIWLWNILHNLILLNSTCSWVNIFVDPGTTFKSTNQIWGTSLQIMSSLGLKTWIGASTSVLFIYHFPLIFGITYG